MEEHGELCAPAMSPGAARDLDPPPPASPGCELPPYADVINVEVTTVLQRMFDHPAVVLTRKSTRFGAGILDSVVKIYTPDCVQVGEIRCDPLRPKRKWNEPPKLQVIVYGPDGERVLRISRRSCRVYEDVEIFVSEQPGKAPPQRIVGGIRTVQHMSQHQRYLLFDGTPAYRRTNEFRPFAVAEGPWRKLTVKGARRRTVSSVENFSKRWARDPTSKLHPVVVCFDRNYDTSVVQVPCEDHGEAAGPPVKLQFENKDPVRLSSDARTPMLIERVIVVATAFLSDYDRRWEEKRQPLVF